MQFFDVGIAIETEDTDFTVGDIDYYLDVIQQNKTESTGGGTGGITPSGTKEISIVQNGESTEDVTRYASAHIVVDVPMPEPPAGVKEISVTENGVSTHDVSAFAQAEVTVAVPEPAGEKQITTNGKHDVKAFASVDVNVPSEGITPTGTKEITSNGTHDVTEFAQAKVNVPIPAEPTGTKDITENGVYDIKAFANVNVQVPVGVNPQGTKEISVTENGEKTEDVTNFKNVHIVTNVPSSGGGVSQEKYDALLNVLKTHNNQYDFENDELTSLKDYAFYNDRYIRSAVLQNVKEIGENAFANCKALASVSADNVSNAGRLAFNGAGLEQAVFPNLGTIRAQAFAWCASLVKVKCDKATMILDDAFNGCANLETVDILGGSSLSSFSQNPLTYFKNLVMRDTSKVTSTGSLSWMPSTASIYVPDALVEQYKTATNWSQKASQIKPLSEYKEV